MSTRIEITAITAIGDGQGNRYTHGQVVDVDDQLAESWIAAGHAVKAGKSSSGSAERPGPPEAATATNEPTRTTAARSRRSTKSTE